MDAEDGEDGEARTAIKPFLGTDFECTIFLNFSDLFSPFFPKQSGSLSLKLPARLPTRYSPPPPRSFVGGYGEGAGGAALTSLRAVPAREGGAGSRSEPGEAARGQEPPSHRSVPASRSSPPCARRGRGDWRATRAGPEPGDSLDQRQRSRRRRSRPTPAVASWGPGPLPVTRLQVPSAPARFPPALGALLASTNSPSAPARRRARGRGEDMLHGQKSEKREAGTLWQDPKIVL
ncbi:uncharacterized protein LOC124976330 [Sciurus carolinensis]|uniref:uncharacterized protein LOC124976330 n=1 Tax=Sciurus carolinensis TaxID=30640 RepID=UPI001FB29563|nr:uncharacterized protein LOC124976330 [Sciurus carolinensis]